MSHRYTKRHAGQAIISGLAVVLLTASLAYIALHQFIAMLDRPEVHVSYATGQCVEVVDHKARQEGRKSKWSCEKLPEDYEHIWVY